MMTQRVSFLIPSTTAASNSGLLLASRKATHSAAKPAMQNSTRETFPVTATTIMMARKTRSGKHAPNVPP